MRLRSGIPLACVLPVLGFSAFVVSASAQPSVARPASHTPQVAAAATASATPAAVRPASAAAAKGLPVVDLLSRGQSLFEDQRYEESIQTLSAALLRPSNAKEQRILIYRLLAKNYITLGRREEAESAVRGLLALAPAHALPEGESPRFRDFFAEVSERWEAEGRPGLLADEAPVVAPVALRQAAPSEGKSGQSLAIRVATQDPEKRIKRLKLFVRTGATGKFAEVSIALPSGREWTTGTIPASFIKPPLLEYYVQASDAGGIPLAARGDAEDPLRIAVPEPAKGWILPVAIGSGVVGAAAIALGLALAGVFKGNPAPSPATRGTVTIIVGD
jgi:tetratricopeptide (TPR) repeat protein